MKKLYLCLLLLSLVACEKDVDVMLSYPATYHAVRLESTSGVRLFTKAGEITNSEVIERFTGKYGAGYFYKNKYSYEVVPPNADSLMITTASEALYKRKQTWQDYKFRKSGDLAEFISKDTAIILVDSRATAHVLKLHKALFKYTHEYEKTYTMLASSSELSDIQHVVQKKVAQVKQNRLLFPWLSYVLVNTKPEFRSKHAMQGINNELKSQPDYSQLNDNDTIAVQGFELIFEKD